MSSDEEHTDTDDILVDSWKTWGELEGWSVGNPNPEIVADDGQMHAVTIDQRDEIIETECGHRYHRDDCRIETYGELPDFVRASDICPECSESCEVVGI